MTKKKRKEKKGAEAHDRIDVNILWMCLELPTETKCALDFTKNKQKKYPNGIEKDFCSHIHNFSHSHSQSLSISPPLIYLLLFYYHCCCWCVVNYGYML